MASHGDTVLFLGAGASAPFGYPVTAGIFKNLWESINGRRAFPASSTHPDIDRKPTAHDLIPLRDGVEDLDALELLDRTADGQRALVTEWQEELKKGLCRLMPGLQRPDAVLPSITDVLSIIDHFLGSRDAAAPMFQPAFLEELRTRLEHAILKVLGGRDSLQDFHARRHLLAQLARWLSREAAAPGGPVTVVSTNYDILLELELYGPGGPLGPPIPLHDSVDFGFPWREPLAGGVVRHTPPAPAVRIFKLHGSLNWLRCALWGYTFIQRGGAIFDKSFQGELVTSNCCWCGHGALRPVIVAPSAVRQIQDPNLLMLWQRALEALRTARNWYIIGYSLPSEDLAIRSILMRAYRGRRGQGLPTIQVIDWEGLVGDARQAHEGRYRLLFPDCQFHYAGIQGFIERGPPSAGVAGALPPSTPV